MSKTKKEILDFLEDHCVYFENKNKFRRFVDNYNIRSHTYSTHTIPDALYGFVVFKYGDNIDYCYVNKLRGGSIKSELLNWGLGISALEVCYPKSILTITIKYNKEKLKGIK